MGTVHFRNAEAANSPAIATWVGDGCNHIVCRKCKLWLLSGMSDGSR